MVENCQKRKICNDILWKICQLQSPVLERRLLYLSWQKFEGPICRCIMCLFHQESVWIENGVALPILEEVDKQIPGDILNLKNLDL